MATTMSIHVLALSVLACSSVLICSLLGVCIYNLYFHPYAAYPGPFLARASPLYALWHAYHGDLHIDTLLCHQKYGSVVRYSPNRLIFNTTSANKEIYGQGRNFQKAQGYAAHPYFPGVTNTHNTIDKTTHARKRRIVAQGFSESAMSSSEEYILTHVRNLCNSLLNPSTTEADGWSQPFDMASWTNYFTLDVISDLTFGRSFDMLLNDKLHWLVDAIVSGNRHIYMRFAYPALFNLDPSKWYSPARWLFPAMPSERSRFNTVLEQYTQARMAMISNPDPDHKEERKDIMSALLAARDPNTNTSLTHEEVWTEAHLMIAAGGDTTSTAFAAVLFYLSRNPKAYARLAHEIRSTFHDIESIRRGPLLRSCRYLRACLDEALRLAPAAPGALWREACSGGATVDGVYIPTGMDAGVSVYALGHNDAYFSEPFAFRPERFLNSDLEGGLESPYESEGVESADYISRGVTPYATRHDKTAFAPFSIGPRGCLAKPLAYLELSLALARIMYCMDFESVGSLGEGFPTLGRGRERREEFQVWDMFSSNKHGPILRFKARA